jgi:hypothetical protein
VARFVLRGKDMQKRYQKRNRKWERWNYKQKGTSIIEVWSRKRFKDLNHYADEKGYKNGKENVREYSRIRK